MITLKAVGVNDPMKTRLNWNSARIEVWTATNGGTQVLSPTNYSPASSMPTQLWVKGVSVSATGPTKDASGNWTSCGPEHITLEAINNGDLPTTPGTYYDRIAFTVVNVDVDAFWPAIISTLGQAVTEAEEDDPMNLFLAVNDDDDNGDGVVDNEGVSASSIDAEDDEMAALIVRQFAPSGLTGTLTMEIPSGLRLFSAAGVPVSTPVTVDLSAPTGPLAGILTGDVKFFIEATATSSNAAVVLRFTPSVGSSITDAVHMTLTTTDVTGGFTRGSVQYAAATKHAGRWYAGGTLDSNHPLSVMVPVPPGLFGVTTAQLKYNLESGGTAKNAVLLNSAYFVTIANLWNAINNIIWPYWPPPPYTASYLANELSIQTGIPAYQLNLGFYFCTEGLETPGLYTLTFSKGSTTPFSKERLTIIKVDINGDYNRDANPVDHANETDAVTFDGPKGMVILANTDDDVADAIEQADCEDVVINGANDLPDIYTLKLEKLGIAAGDIPAGMTLEMSVEKPSVEASGAPAAKDRVRIFRSKAQDAQGVVGPDTLPDKVVFKKSPLSSDMDIDLLGGTGDLEMGIEGIEYGREVIVKLVLKLNGQELYNDSVRLLVSPFLALSNIDKVTKVYVAGRDDPYSWPDFYNSVAYALNGLVPIESYGPETFIQDFAEIGCSRSAPGQTVRKLCVMMGLQGGWFKDYIDANNGYFRTEYGNIGGNIETSPSLLNFDYGRLIVGQNLHLPAKEFLKAQKLQTENGNLIELPVAWLAVGHVDEVFTIVPAGSGFKVLVADLQLAINILRNNPGEETSAGFAPRADILAVYDDPGNALTLALITNKLAAVRSALSSGLGINEADFIKVPVPFTVHGGMLNPEAQCYLPNMINMLVVRNAGGQRKLAVPNPCFGPILQTLATDLSNIGYQQNEIKTVDTSGPHAGLGEAHCATNARREAP
jgi:hypothetical protein